MTRDQRIQAALRQAEEALENLRREIASDAAMLPVVKTPPGCRVGGYVYFVQCDEPRRSIKIGSTNDLDRRLRTMRVSTPFEMRLIGYYWSTEFVVGERFLHELHAEDRIRGEWFLPSERVLASLHAAKFRAKREPERAREREDDPYAGVVGEGP